MAFDWELPEDYEGFTAQQLKFLSIVSRTAAAVGLLSSLTMIALAYRNRIRLYHRLVLGLSIHMVLMCAWQLYGAAAIPKDYPYAWGNYGTVTTCQVQGLGLYLTFSGPLYYVGLSLYSYFAVRSNFRVQQYLWIEKYIHFGVHFFPMAGGMFLWQQDAFHYGGNTSACYVASVPYGCGYGTDVKCVHGPQNIEVFGLIFLLIPVLWVLLLPTLVMMALYWQVRRKQGKFVIPASTVAQQAALYLLAAWISGMFFLTSATMDVVARRQVFWAGLLSSSSLSLFPLWMLLVYWKFRIVSTTTSSSRRFLASFHGVPSSLSHSSNHHKEKAPVIESKQQQQEQQEEVIVFETAKSSEFRFNIFDGTNAEGDFAEFIHEGDSDDRREDHKESLRWETIQDHV